MLYPARSEPRRGFCLGCDISDVVPTTRPHSLASDRDKYDLNVGSGSDWYATHPVRARLLGRSNSLDTVLDTVLVAELPLWAAIS